MPFNLPTDLIPENEIERVQKLQEFNINGALPEQEFDLFSTLAASIFAVPMAFISFVDAEKVVDKSAFGTERQESGREKNLASIAILNKDITVIEDTYKHPELKQFAGIKNKGRIRFYAAAPIISTDGFAVGAIGIADEKPGQLTTNDLNILSTLATLIADKLEQKLKARKAMEVQTEFINRSVHDLNNYLGNLMLASSMLNDGELDEQLAEFPQMISRNATRISDKLKNMLKFSRIEGNGYKVNLKEIDCNEILNSVIEKYAGKLAAKNIRVIKQYEGELHLIADKKILTEIFENLLSNGIKFSPPNTAITISAVEDAGNVVIGFHDEGQGLQPEELDRIFLRYAKFSSVPTAKESSVGIGLSVTKILVELLKGNIVAESKGKDQGASFIITLPTNK